MQKKILNGGYATEFGGNRNMTGLPRIILIGVLLTLFSGTSQAAETWVACGDDQLLFYEIQGEAIKEVDRINWLELTIPDEFSEAKNLGGIVECKPVNNGRDILITSWMGGVARLDLAQRVVTFSAEVPHAHSAEMLPGNRIAFIGNRLRVFDENNGRTPLIDFKVDDGHGLVWDSEKAIIYVLSQNYIEEFALVNWEGPAPELKSIARTKLPGESDGHDLSKTDNGLLLVSTRDGVWCFNPSDRSFLPVQDLNPLFRVQSIVESEGAKVWVQAEESWWGRGFYLMGNGSRPQRIETPELRLYKVRRLS